MTAPAATLASLGRQDGRQAVLSLFDISTNLETALGKLQGLCAVLEHLTNTRDPLDGEDLIDVTPTAEGFCFPGRVLLSAAAWADSVAWPPRPGAGRSLDCARRNALKT